MLDSYVLTIATMMAIWSIATLGLNVMTGWAGQLNLGIGVYMGTGAYMSAALTTMAGFTFWQAVVPAVLAAGAMGLLTGLPALRVREDSLAVLTIGLVFVFESSLVYFPYLGGPVGINRIPKVIVGGEALGNGGYLVVALLALCLAIAVSWYLKRTWMGLALEGVREDEHATAVIGINPVRFKLYAFTIGGAFAGVAGVLYAHFIRFITPYDFGFTPSIFVLVMLVFGGLGTIRGAVFGACLLTALPEMIRFVQDYRSIMYGIVLVLLMLYEPRGMLGDGSFLWRNILRAAAKVRSWTTKPVVVNGAA
jgi:branched-chain amino acid transport system permease protein